MAKKIRFPLKMKNGTDVRTLDELKENFDLESVLGYFTDGRLATWLSDRYYDEKAEAVAALSADTPDLNAKLCEILEIEYEAEADETDVELIARRREKLQIISGVTDNREILDNIDCVALDQDDLYDILDEGANKVYLYGQNFRIPYGKKNIFYIGINCPLIILDRSKTFFEYDEADIAFKNISLEESAGPMITKGEKLFLEGMYAEAFPLIKKSAENDNPRAMYILSLFYGEGYDVTKISEVEQRTWIKKAAQYKEALSLFEYSKSNKCTDEQKHFLFAELDKLYRNGDVFALAALGYCYTYGHCVEKNCSKGYQFLITAAEQGLALAQYVIADGYYYGYNELETDEEKGVKWYTKAAKQGYVSSQYRLGFLYYEGYGVDQDYSIAFEWYSKAAKQGYSLANFELGEMYFTGTGVTQNYYKAFDYYTKASEGDYSDADYKLGLIYENGYCVRKSYENASKHFLRYANSTYSLNKIGEMYESGKEVSQNYDKALEWYIRSVDHEGTDDSDANDSRIAIGRIYDKVYNDYSQACEWYRKALSKNDSAANSIGQIYEEGVYVDQDYYKAFEWYRIGAERGNTSAQMSLGDLYKKGLGVNKDMKLAKEWHSKAIEQMKNDVDRYQKEVEMRKREVEEGDTSAILLLSGAELKLSSAEMRLSSAELKLSLLNLL